MEIQYKNKELQKCAEQPGYAQRKLGVEQAKAFLRRINVMLAASCFEDLRNVPGHFHELHHNRKGQWGFDLNGPYRLIATPMSTPIPLDSHGGFDWKAIKDAVIVEIVNYHKEGD
jgi:proteic killer suppression protein